MGRPSKEEEVKPEGVKRDSAPTANRKGRHSRHSNASDSPPPGRKSGGDDPEEPSGSKKHSGKKSLPATATDMTPEALRTGRKSVNHPQSKLETDEEESSMAETEDTEAKYEAMGQNIEIPAPYWEEKVAKSFDIIKELKKIPEMKRAFKERPFLAEEFMKHPDIAKEIARDHELGLRIIARPELLRELALVHQEITEGNIKHVKRNSNLNDLNPMVQWSESHASHAHHHKVHDGGHSHEHKEGQYNRKSAPNSHDRHHHSHGHGHHDEQDHNHHHHHQEKGHKGHGPRGSLSIPAMSTTTSVDSSMVSQMSRATLPNVKAPPDGPESLKYLVDSARLFMNHHIEVADGFCCTCDKRREYFDVLNVYGRLIYRVYETRKRCCDYGIFKSFQMAVNEPDGTSSIIMTKTWDIFRNMRKIAVYCPPGRFIGSVEERWGICSPKIVLRNGDNDAMIDIRVTNRPFSSRFKYHPDFEFELRTIGDHNAIGKISAEWLDLPPGAFKNERVYGVNFPKELNCNVKIIVMTAWFLVYKLYFDGKIKRVVRHDLAENERALIEYAAADIDPSLPVPPPSDSEISVPP